MSNPLVSVVIPTYNTEKYITEALKSVFQQKYRPIEVIVVDDGSTDNTAEIIRKYVQTVQSVRDVDSCQTSETIEQLEQAKRSNERSDRTIRTSPTSKAIELIYIYQKNGGRASARNTGIRAARGKYVAFLDSDDLWTLWKLEKQVHTMEENTKIDFLFGDKQRFSDGGKIVIHSMFQKNGYDEKFFGDPLYVRNAYQKLLKANFIPTGTVILRRDCFERTGLFDESIYAEDYEFWLRIALFNTIGYANELWELERDREGSGSKNLKAVYLSNIQTLEKHERAYRERLSKLHINLNNIIRDAYRDTGYFFLTHDKLLARDCFKKSLLRGFQIKTLFYWIATFLGVSFVKAIQQARQ
jgi:glycosyltransferase involved in cell wall biosynthesis